MLLRIEIIILSVIFGVVPGTALDRPGEKRLFADEQTQLQAKANHLEREGKNAKATLRFLAKSSQALLAQKEDALEAFEREHKFVLNRELFLLGSYHEANKSVTLNEKLLGLTYGYHLTGKNESQMTTLMHFLLSELYRTYVASDVDCTDGRLQEYLTKTDYHEKVFFSTEETKLIEDLLNGAVTQENLADVYGKINGKLDGSIAYIKKNLKTHSDGIIQLKAGFEMLSLSNYFQLRSIQHVLLQHMFKIFFTSAIHGEDSKLLDEINKNLLADTFELFLTNLEINGDKGKDVFVEFANAKNESAIEGILTSFATVPFSRLANMLPLAYETVGPLSGDVNTILSHYKGLLDEKVISERYKKVLEETSTAVTTLKNSMMEQTDALKFRATLVSYTEDISKKVVDGLASMVEYIKSSSNSSLEVLNSNLTDHVTDYLSGAYNKTRFDYLDASYYNRSGFNDFLNVISKDLINSFIIRQFYYSVTGDRAAVAAMDRKIKYAAKRLFIWRKKENLVYEIFFFTDGVIKNVNNFLPSIANGTPDQVAEQMSSHLKTAYPSCGFSVAATKGVEHFWAAETIEQRLYDMGMTRVSYKTSEGMTTIIVFMETHQWTENKQKSQTIDIKTKITEVLDKIATDKSAAKEVEPVIQAESAKQQFMSGAYGMHIPKDESFALKSTIEGASEVLVDRAFSANPAHREIVAIVY